MAMPVQIGRPWPSAPVFCSIPGTLRVGCPTKCERYWHKRLQFLFRKESPLGQHDEQRLDRMALALHVAVAAAIRDGPGRDAKDAVVEHIQNVDARQAAARVARARVLDRLQDALAVLQRFQRELLIREHAHAAAPSWW